MDSMERLLLAAGVAVNVMVVVLIIKNRRARRKPRQVWSKTWFQRREGRSVLNLLNTELRQEDPRVYKNFLRLSHAQFERLLDLVRKDIEKEDTLMRDSISAQSRLEVTLRFLATGESYRSLMYSTRIHESTISKFVPKVCSAIYNNLRALYLLTPKTTEAWKEIAEGFNSTWNFPHCLGALDGRHIRFKAPTSDGSYYYNYKGFNSIVLLAMCDAKYKFTYVNVGVNGRISDGGVFQQSFLQKAMTSTNNILNLPLPEVLPTRNCEVPYVVVADDAFPLSDRLMKLYPQRRLTHDLKIFNYRLSRARRMIESSFGILANRFRVLLNSISLSAEKVETITLACVVLHNFIIIEGDSNYIEVPEEMPKEMLPGVGHQGGHRSASSSRSIRDEFKDFFNSAAGSVPWQENAVQNNNL